ncbi:MAG: DNA polymerase III subunit gamma and tau [Propionibacteriaceae bacterium]|nr:DNA polymerase III subunit gamma and tau [Propionibacteriaceae bacterium]
MERDPASQAGGGVQAPPLALYRRYRPDTFAEVIGQEHVTEPLQRALANNRVNHAYLFSGPRGCGKTTSARILARALNCAQGPAPVPCGECQSCRELARGGPGSIDVIEIDAASHGGVNEARDLRERAFFSPVSSRYKIYIVDEAHMVTKEGFNALLKVVEEPPPHVKFIFATTEPDKVLPTIRSRTHHYPFRLVPPKTLAAYLGQVCEAEHVRVEAGVLPLVVRAGAGSVRDSLSVLDQLLGGAADGGVTYAQAASLLGFTPDALLDEIVDAFAAGDAAGVFSAVDKVIEIGQDPRRFAEDLLGRLRDLIIVAAVPSAISSGLIDVADDQAERLRVQAKGLGAGELTRAAEVMATGLTQMRGTTAPRLHLELMCARVLLPGADVDERGIHARLERLERRLGMVEGVPDGSAALPNASATAAPPAAKLSDSAPPSLPAGTASRQTADRKPTSAEGEAASPTPVAPTGPTPSAPPAAPLTATPAGQSQTATPARQAQPSAAAPDRQAPSSEESPSPSPAATPTPQAPSSEATPAPSPAATPARQAPPTQPSATAPAQPTAATPARQAQPIQPSAATMAQASPRPAAPDPAALTAADLRRLWPQILDEVKAARRFTWIVLSQNAQVGELREGVVTLLVNNPGAAETLGRTESMDVIRQAVKNVLVADIGVEIDSGQAGAPPPRQSADRPAARAAAPQPPEAEASPDDPVIDEAASAEELFRTKLGAELIEEEPPT